jgi:SP family galactose:H+ symporter-like MFS transporter
VEESAGRWRSVSRINVLIAITAAIIGLIYGYDLGSIASALLFLVPAFDLNTFMTSVVTSAVVLGQLFGALYAGCISNTIGRKHSLVLVALGYAVFAGLGLRFREFPRAPAHPGGSAMLTEDLFANFIVGVVFLGALGSLGGSVTFGIFLASVSFAFVYVLAPETKGRPLEAIRTYLYNGRRWSEESSI